MKKFLSIIVFICHSSFCLMAQQQGQFTQYMNNNFLLNPAEGGSDEFTDIKLGARKQWQGIEGAPQSLFLSAHHPIKKQGKIEGIVPLAHHGVGGYVISDQMGPVSLTSAFLSYSYHLPLNEKMKLSLGVFAGGKQFAFDVNDVQFDELGSSDVTIEGNNSKFVPDVAAGLWLYGERIYAGVSSFQLLNNKLDISSEPGVQSGNLSRHFFLTSGYKVDITEDWFLVPSFVLKYVTPAPIQIDLNMKLKYKDVVWAGVSYRNKDAVNFLIGGTIKKVIDVGYSYDYNVSGLSDFNSGSHEILLGYRIHKTYEQPPAQFW